MVDFYLTPGYKRAEPKSWWERHRIAIAVSLCLLVVGLGAGFAIGWAVKPNTNSEPISAQESYSTNSKGHATSVPKHLATSAAATEQEPVAASLLVEDDVWRLTSQDYKDGLIHKVVDFMVYVRDSLPPVQSKLLVTSSAEELQLVERFFPKYFMAFWQSQHPHVLKLLRHYGQEDYVSLDTLLANPETSRQAFDLFEALQWYNGVNSGEDLIDQGSPQVEAQWQQLKAQFERQTSPPSVMVYDEEPWQMLLLKERPEQARATAYMSHFNINRTSVSTDERERFPLVVVPVVFQVLQYRSSSGDLLPAWQYASFRHILDNANKQLEQDGVSMRLELHEVRDGLTHSYLLMDGYSAWQTCSQPSVPGKELASRESCLTPLAKQNNADVTKFVNVYVSGTFLLPGGGDLAAGFTVLGDTLGETSPEQYIWLRWDRVDSSVDNNAESWEAGVASFLEQFGHYMGLYKTHAGGCEDRDLIADTAPNRDMNGEPWKLELDAWCQGFQKSEKWVQGGKLLMKFSSCQQAQHASGNGQVDNLFNFMSNNPSACKLYFTLQQVQRMQVVMKMLRKVMFSSAR